MRRHRLSGTIASAGFSSGDRVVVGIWDSGPLGPMNDVMWVRLDGHRILLAPNDRVARFVRAVYEFDEVRIVSIEVDRSDGGLTISAGPIEMSLEAGRRWPIPLAALRPAVITRYLEGPIAKVLMGVSTHGTTISGVEEWYCADSYSRVTRGKAVIDGRDCGELGPLSPPLGIGISNPPRKPSIVEIRPLLFDRSGCLDGLTSLP